MHCVALPWWGWGIQIAALVGAVVLMYRITFEDWDDFVEAVKFWLTPDIISIFRGEWTEDMWAELKLTWFLLGVAVLSGLVYFGLTRLAA